MLNTKELNIKNNECWVRVNNKEEYELAVKYFSKYLNIDLVYDNFVEEDFIMGYMYAVLYLDDNSVGHANMLPDNSRDDPYSDNTFEELKWYAMTRKDTIEVIGEDMNLNIKHDDYVTITCEEDYDIAIKAFKKYFKDYSKGYFSIPLNYGNLYNYLQINIRHKKLVLLTNSYEDFKNEITISTLKKYLSRNDIPKEPKEPLEDYKNKLEAINKSDLSKAYINPPIMKDLNSSFIEKIEELEKITKSLQVQEFIVIDEIYDMISDK